MYTSIVRIWSEWLRLLSGKQNYMFAKVFREASTKPGWDHRIVSRKKKNTRKKKQENNKFNLQ